MTSHTALPPDLDALVATELARAALVRAQLLRHHPFWGHLLLEARLLADPGLGTLAATDCVCRIWLNPVLTRHLSHAELGFVLLHELCHIVFESGARRHGRDRRLWNEATDYAINALVEAVRDLETGKPLYALPCREVPGFGKMRPPWDPRFSDMPAEAIYETLLRDPPADSTDDTFADVQPETPGASPVRVPVQAGAIDAHVDAAELDDTTAASAQHDARARVARAVEHARSQDYARRGQIPSSALRALHLDARPRLPWRRLLRDHVEGALAEPEFTRAPPHRRYAALDLVMPSLRPRPETRLVVALDTSASMTEADLRAVATEITALVGLCDEAVLLVHDAAIQAVFHGAQAKRGALATASVKGGGGTDHTPVFEWLRRQLVAPTIFVGLTDLGTRWPDVRPDHPVLWVVPARHRGRAPRVLWGTVVWVAG